MHILNSKPLYQKPLYVGLFVFCVLMAITQYLSFQKYLLNRSAEKQNTINELNRISDQFQTTLNNSLSVTKTLAFIVDNYGIPEDFSTVGKELLENNSNINAVQLLQNGVITHVYPLKENEVLIGYNVLGDSSRNKELIKSYDKGEFYFSGPFELRQGGMGVVGRFPIKHKKNYDFAAVIIKFSSLLESSGILTANSSSNFVFQLSKINLNTNKEEFFLPVLDAKLLNESIFINIPQGDWKLYATTIKSNRWDGVIELILLGLILSFLGGYIFWYILKQPFKLEKLVREKTKTIQSNKNHFKALVENSLDAVAILNQEGFNLYASPSITSVLGYTVKEILKINLFEILHEDDKPLVVKSLNFVMQNTGHPINGHFSRIKHKDGSWRWVESIVTNLLDNPSVNGIVINFRDITQKKNAEDQLLKEKALSDAVINSLPGIFYFYNKAGKFLNWNTNFEFVSGYSTSEIKNMHPIDFYAEEDKAYISEKIKEVFEKGESFAETYFYTKNKEKIYYYFTGKSIQYEDEWCLIGVGIDMTQRKNAEIQKEFEHRDKEALINSTNDLIWSISKNLKLIAGNKAFLESNKKYTGKEISIGDSIFINEDDYNKEYIDYWKTNYVRALQGEFFALETFVPSNQYEDEHYIETNFNPIYNKEIIEGVACFSRNVTENRMYQKAILKTNTKLETAQEIAKLGYWELDLKTNVLFWTSQVYAIWGVTENTFKVSFDNLIATIHPEDKAIFLKHQKEALIGLHPMHVEHRILKPNGEVIWVREIGKLVLDIEGTPIYFEGSVQDITAQKITEIELKEQNQFITTAIDNLPVGIALRDIKTGVFTLINKNFTEIYGWPKEDLIDVETFFKNVYPKDSYRKDIQNQIYKDIASKDTKRMNWEGLQITTKKGEKRFTNAKNIPLYEQNIMISTVLDVTEKVLAEEELQKSNERYEYVTKATFDAIWDWDLDNETIYWGVGFQTIFGHKNLKNNFKAWTANIHPEDLDRVVKSINASIAGVEKNWAGEYRYKRENGKYAFVKDKGIILRNMDGKAIRMVGAIQDTTQQKEYEKRILDVNEKLRYLSAHLQTAREEERITIAREIHDELGQQLTGIKLDASWLKNKTAVLYPEGIERTTRLINSINLTINKVRKIATDLRPGVLDDLGLEAAMEWHLEHFEEQSGISCTLKTKSIASHYNKDINTSIYRIFQEALTNVMRHSEATKVEIKLYEKNEHLILEILDNGKGITETEKNNNLSLGISGMKERAIMLNGDFLLKKRKERGTQLIVSIPLNNQKENL